MRAWAGLFKKDFKLTRTVFFIGLVFNFLFLLLALYVGTKVDNKLLMFIPLLIAVVFHVLYFPIMVFISLKTEANQLHLWLHNPQSGAKLILSKVLNGIIMTVVSLVVLYVMTGLLIIPNFSFVEAYWPDAWVAGMLAFLHIIIVTVAIGVWVIFLWTTYQFFKCRIGRWSWLALLGTFIIIAAACAIFESTNLYALITEWGSLEMNFTTFPMDPIQAYAGQYLYNFIFFLGLFYVSTWMIDKKVEV
jgi:hypothetical protein